MSQVIFRVEKGMFVSMISLDQKKIKGKSINLKSKVFVVPKLQKGRIDYLS